jgi:NAD(P)-dependent dehydrogenase (short-subunit alcohol dehydrogenase family)
VSGPRGVIVAGGTGALGRAIVEALLAGGTRVAVPYMHAAGWDEVRALGKGTSLFGAQADLGDAGATRAFVDQAAAFLGVLDGVAIASGAWSGGTTLEAAPADEWDRMMTTNLATVHSVCRAALPRLLKQGGSVVTVGSKVAETGGAGAAAYAVSKAAVHALTRVLALENRDRGVRFNCVLPQVIDTPANRKAMPDADHAKWTSPAAIASVIAFLLSPASAPVTGALVPVDGRGSGREPL